MGNVRSYILCGENHDSAISFCAVRDCAQHQTRQISPEHVARRVLSVGCTLYTKGERNQDHTILNFAGLEDMMWQLLFKLVGNVWMFPMTVLAALYLGVFRMMGWVRFERLTPWAILLCVPSGNWLYNKMKGKWSGWASGPFVIMRWDYLCNKKSLLHETQHVKQHMVAGIFYIPMYILMSTTIWLFWKNKHAYYDNPYERAARKAAGQQVDRPKEAWEKENDRWPWW